MSGSKVYSENEYDELIYINNNMDNLYDPYIEKHLYNKVINFIIDFPDKHERISNILNVFKFNTISISMINKIIDYPDIIITISNIYNYNLLSTILDKYIDLHNKFIIKFNRIRFSNVLKIICNIKNIDINKYFIILAQPECTYDDTILFLETFKNIKNISEYKILKLGKYKDYYLKNCNHRILNIANVICSKVFIDYKLLEKSLKIVTRYQHLLLDLINNFDNKNVTLNMVELVCDKYDKKSAIYGDEIYVPIKIMIKSTNLVSKNKKILNYLLNERYNCEIFYNFEQCLQQIIK